MMKIPSTLPKGEKVCIRRHNCIEELEMCKIVYNREAVSSYVDLNKFEGLVKGIEHKHYFTEEEFLALIKSEEIQNEMFWQYGLKN